MERPSISVVIATHNRRAFLAEAVASVRAQTLASWELLVVDDASEDDSWEWLTRERDHDERLRIFRLGENSQRAVAANHALAQAQGEFTMFLDDDDLLRPEAFAQLAEALRQDESAVAEERVGRGAHARNRRFGADDHAHRPEESEGPDRRLPLRA